jgi:hypothetical protein
MNVTYENLTDQITLEQATWMHERLGIAVIVNDGKDVTLEIEEPIRHQAK